MRSARPTLWLAASVGFVLLAIVLGAAAFTRFDRSDPLADGSPEVEAWNERAYRDAQLSAGLGVACAFSLLGAFACGQRWASRKSQAAADSLRRDSP